MTPASDPSADPLIRTKLRLPFVRPALVSRPRLQEQLAHGLQGPLTLVAAPAGFGKTTLVASSIAACGLPVAWLSLDKNDNRAGRFLSYLIAALREADGAIGNEAAQMLAAAQPPPPEAVLTSLINDLDGTGREVVLVLDDYQFIRNEAVHEEVTFLLDHCPHTLHLVIASRSDPPLPLTLLRARGHMVELRAADLRFTRFEAAQFLNDVMGLHLDPQTVAALDERTEGWIAGLKMAALTMRDHKDIPAFITGFSGTSRYILDYLLEEVLASQPPSIQRFLLHTSVLERLTAPLCDALLATGQALEQAPPHSEFLLSSGSASILHDLERANIFVVPLDDERVWYRYHHLFADLLRAQLQRSLGAAGVARLHARAAAWHGQHGTLVEGIHHAALALDDELVEHFVQRSYLELVSRGEQSWIRAWTGELSDELIYSRPWLCIYDAYSHSWFGELERADRLLAESEKHLPSMPATEAGAVRGLVAYVKSRVTAMRGDLPQAIALCQQARATVSPTNLALQLDTAITLGYEYFLQGDYARAGPILQETIRLGTHSGAVINTVAASCVLARLAAIEGRLREADDHYQTAARLIPADGGQHRGARALVEVGLAEQCYERNELDAALAHVQQGLDLLHWWGKRDDLALAQVTTARIQWAQGNETAALETMAAASRLIQTRAVFSEARHAVERLQFRLWLAQGNLHAAGRWAAGQEESLSAAGPLLFEEELARIAQARLWLAQNRPRAAARLLPRLEQTARSAGRMGRVVEILLLKSLALHAAGDARGAMLALGDCLALAGPEGYVRLFLDDGPPTKELLTAWLARNDASSLSDYATYLLAQFPTRPLAQAQAPAPSQPLVAPLSQRELEVLRHIATGETNQEIARQLIVAPGTIKAHTSSIYRKLDVAHRTEAVARARQLGLLP